MNTLRCSAKTLALFGSAQSLVFSEQYAAAKEQLKACLEQDGEFSADDVEELKSIFKELKEF